MKTFKQFQEGWSNKYKKSIDCSNPKGFSQKAHCAGRKKKSMNEMNSPRIPKKSGQPDKSDKHSDLYTDEDPKGTIQGLGFKDVATAKASISKIKNSGRSHAHKIQAAIAMEQRAKVAGKSSEAAVYRKFINSMKEKTKEMNEESKKCKPGYYYCYTDKVCKTIPAGFMVDPAGMLAKENGASIDEEGLRDWFGKSKSKDGKSGWVNVVTGGTCASDEPGEGTPKCVSSAKRASMTKAERLSAAKRKKAADPGQQSKSGAAKPTYVSTDSPKKKMNENHNAIASGKEKDEEGYMANTEMDTINSAVKKLRKNIKKGNMQLPAWVQSKITKAADYIDTAADYMNSNEMSEESDAKGKGSGKKDACYHKVKSRYSVWPSAYASGALVKCRKVGADSWGNKSESVTIETADGRTYAEFINIIGSEEMIEASKKCWPGYKKKGTQKLFGKTYNRCVKEEESELLLHTDVLSEKIKNMCNNTHEGDVCPMHGKKECPSTYKKDSNIDEATRIQASTGNIILTVISWRGKTFTLRMFFPQTKKPTRAEVQDQVQKVYPGSRVTYYNISDYKPGEPFLHVNEDWQKVNRQDKTDGLSQKAVDAYRSENPGSKLQTAVTEKKPSGKRAQRRLNFCRRMKGMKSKLTSAKTSRDPDSRINKALRRWNCN
jgi:hypothetical protein